MPYAGGVTAPPDPRTFARLLDGHAVGAALALLEPHLPGFSPDPHARRNHTLSAYLATLRRFLTWADQEWRSVTHPDPRLGADYLAHLSAQGLSPTSVRAHHSRLHRSYARLAELGLVAPGTAPFALLDPVKIDASALRDAYSVAELRALHDHADAPGRALLLLGAHAGLSKDEALGLRWTDIHNENGRLQLLGREVLRPRALRAALNAHAVAGGQAGLDAPHGARPLFSVGGERALRRWLWGLCRRAGVAPLAWSGLRNHALLRAVQGHRTRQVEHFVTRSKERNSRVVKVLKAEPLVRGPRRRRTEGE